MVIMWVGRFIFRQIVLGISRGMPCPSRWWDLRASFMLLCGYVVSSSFLLAVSFS